MAIKLSSVFSVHPGIWLHDEIVEPNKLKVVDLARHLGVSRQALSSLLNGRTGLTADMAIRFEKAFGLKADTLCRMQASYAMANARSHEDEIKVTRFLEAA
jgi:antitoxin HigA-1